jgi:hypothetical protein
MGTHDQPTFTLPGSCTSYQYLKRTLESHGHSYASYSTTIWQCGIYLAATVSFCTILNLIRAKNNIDMPCIVSKHFGLKTSIALGLVRSFLCALTYIMQFYLQWYPMTKPDPLLARARTSTHALYSTANASLIKASLTCFTTFSTLHKTP